MPSRTAFLVAALAVPALAATTAFAPHQDNPAATHRLATASDNARYEELSTDAGDRDAGAHVKCLLDQGPCGSTATELKQGVPDALEGPCRECTTEQGKYSGNVIAHLSHNRPRTWEELQGKYDPDRSYEDKHAAENGFAEND
ncbi:hypothetical protein [Kitasatospora sp. CB01950]|uniref:hypothetical protein n=1 Tax=Kitasatospora sp. CB01950 TaxID=1703930 RepID=UPI00093F4CB9|nr:hypothetical protein [Kitasatospora sp. CB01950]OKJ13717.1 hypothetical protein AMK19_09795 [Kitasatospora sp. CB01950]